jgi:3-hydroxybenzoate 6-monooxygenase
MPEDRPVLIAGGGIGGLAAALGLAQKRFRSLVLERAPELGETGAGIQLGPNAFHAFDYLGVGDAARAIAIYVDKLTLMDALTGESIASVPLGEPFRKRFGNPYAVVHRGDLHGILLKACRASPFVQIRTSAEVERYEQDGTQVAVRLSSGETVGGAALAGADGLLSKVRAQLAGDGPPRVSGHSTYRSVIPAEQMPADLRWNMVTLWAGPKCHLVHYPLSGGKAFNLVVTCHNDACGPVAGKPVTYEEMLPGFAHISKRALQILEHGSAWKLWVLCDREPILNWASGRVVLLGDAAHPALQYMAQGACMALEDAVCLSHELAAASGDAARAFESYCRKRAHRTARVQLQSRLVGEHIYHPEGAHAALRNAIMRSMSPDDYYDSLQWLYGGSGLAEGSAAIR